MKLNGENFDKNQNEVRMLLEERFRRTAVFLSKGSIEKREGKGRDSSRVFLSSHSIKPTLQSSSSRLRCLK